MLAATAQEKFQTGFGPMPAGFNYVPFNDVAALEAGVTDRTAAVILEPIQGESGIHPATYDYLHAARRVCHAHHALLILDEVQTGFGRTGRFWAHEWAQIHPDIVTLAKAAGGGVALGVCLARPELAAHFGPGTHGCTFGGNPLAAAGGIAALEALDQGGYVERAEALGEYFLAGLQELAARSSLIREVRGRGLMLGIELTPPHGAALVERLLHRQILVHPVGDTIVRILPPLVVTEAEIDQVLSALRKELDALAREERA
jgi:acetylornithine/succinyldiaminopimelate/putrescine aminotransferase